MSDNYPFRVYKEKPLYKGYTTQSVYVPMRDGIIIATEIYLPKNLLKDKKIPTIFVQTCYWRSVHIKVPFKWFRKPPFTPKIVKILTNYGFAVVCIDVRGCGASLGTRPYPFSEEELKDGKEIIDWIIKQPWSNGKIIAFGNSYTGQTAEFVAIHNHPAMKGILPKHNAWDPYSHIGFPGGVFNEEFVNYWSKLGRGQDQHPGKALKAFKPLIGVLADIANFAVKGVKPVDTDKDLSVLKEAINTHRANKYIFDYKDEVEYRDDVIDNQGNSLTKISIFTYKSQIEKSKLPFYPWGSWQDSASADVVISRFLTFDIPQRAIISDFNHTDKLKANPYFSSKAKANPSVKNQIKDWITFFNECLNGKISDEKILFYYTMGEEKWKATHTWPPSGQIYQKWFFEENNTLARTEPSSDDGKDDHKINYTATTGIRNRWYTLLSLPVDYYDRLKEDKKLLTYTSSPLTEDLEITGHPILTLYLSSTHEDGAILSYLEFIDNKGNVKHITEGELRLVCRMVSKDDPPYKIVVPYHSCKKEDAQPLVPGEITEITFGLLPTSILIKKGYKLRVVIAGADKDSFARYPKEGIPTITIERNKNYASYINLPTIPRNNLIF